MAPGLRGEHRTCRCPTCGNRVVIGKHYREKVSGPSPGLYRKAFCPWCGQLGLTASTEPLRGGDQVLVNKMAYLWRRPRRWELVVFRGWGEYLIKRILGLPGEEVLIAGGDIWVNGELTRKSWEELEAVRVLMFDQGLPGPGGWARRWEAEGGSPLISAGEGTSIMAAPILELDGTATPCRLTYRNFSYHDGKCEPLCDEQAYNGGLHPHWETVHDFLVEVEVEVVSGEGTFSLALFDGWDNVMITLPLKERGPLRVTRSEGRELLSEKEVSFPGRVFRIGFALVDRRVLVRIDGKEVMDPIDLAAPPPGSPPPPCPPLSPIKREDEGGVTSEQRATRRAGVVRPLRLGAEAAHVRLRGLRLFRDVHYGQAGTNGVRGRPVRLGPGEYFVLGDNSGRSEDSRCWPGGGAVPEECLVGRPLPRLGASGPGW